MKITRYTMPATVAMLASWLLAGCRFDVNGRQSGKDANVDIRTPAGNLSVRTDVDPRDTGLVVYPGARNAEKENDPGRAGVNIGTAWFGVKVVAAEFESDDAPSRILDFYRNQMKTYGNVTECRGDVDYKGAGKQPRCSEKPASSDIELVAGVEESQRIVTVKPRGSGSEFSLVYVVTRGSN